MKLPIDKPKPRKTTGVRLNEVEREQIQKLADEWTDGDFSKYLRFAALNFDPTKFQKDKRRKK